MATCPSCNCEARAVTLFHAAELETLPQLKAPKLQRAEAMLDLATSVFSHTCGKPNLGLAQHHPRNSL